METESKMRGFAYFNILQPQTLISEPQFPYIITINSDGKLCLFNFIDIRETNERFLRSPVTKYNDNLDGEESKEEAKNNENKNLHKNEINFNNALQNINIDKNIEEPPKNNNNNNIMISNPSMNQQNLMREQNNNNNNNNNIILDPSRNQQNLIIENNNKNNIMISNSNNNIDLKNNRNVSFNLNSVYKSYLII